MGELYIRRFDVDVGRVSLSYATIINEFSFFLCKHLYVMTIESKEEADKFLDEHYDELMLITRTRQLLAFFKRHNIQVKQKF